MLDSEIIVALIGAVVTIGNVVFTTFSNRLAKKRTLESGLQCLLRLEIIRAHEKYTGRKFCPVYARESITKAYDAYHSLGGNGTITNLYKQIMALPIDKEGHYEN